MRKLLFAILLVLMATFLSASTYIISGHIGVDYSDITFWLNGEGSWSPEDYTMDTVTTPTEYSAGDTVATGDGDAAFVAGSADCGTLGSEHDSTGHYFELDTGISSILPGSTASTFQGRVGIRWKYTTWDNSEVIWRSGYDSSNRLTITMDNSEEITFTYKEGGTSYICGTTDANMTSSGTWYTIEIIWDADADTLSVKINGSTPSLDAACTSSTFGGMASALSFIRWGTWLQVGPVDYDIGMIAVSSDKTRDFHELFVTQSICDYPG